MNTDEPQTMLTMHSGRDATVKFRLILILYISTVVDRSNFCAAVWPGPARSIPLQTLLARLINRIRNMRAFEPFLRYMHVLSSIATYVTHPSTNKTRFKVWETISSFVSRRLSTITNRYMCDVQTLPLFA